MADVVFWEKPGCKGNKRQKEILRVSGHVLEERNLLTETWTKELLATFFGKRPVTEWFNPTNPLVKSGEIVPADVIAEDALEMMVEEPLLIVRPLMQVGDERLAGFDVQRVHQWIGLNLWIGKELDVIGEQDPQHCPCVATA